MLRCTKSVSSCLHGRPCATQKPYLEVPESLLQELSNDVLNSFRHSRQILAFAKVRTMDRFVTNSVLNFTDGRHWILPTRLCVINARTWGARSKWLFVGFSFNINQTRWNSSTQRLSAMFLWWYYYVGKIATLFDYCEWVPHQELHAVFNYCILILDWEGGD